MLSILSRPPFRAGSDPSLALLVAVTMTGTVALHIFVPALPSAAADLRTTPLAIQLTITVYLVGLASGQLVYGPLSDRFGRRPVILGSLALYLLGFLLAIPAATVEWLVGARVLQSLGGCGSLVLGRAMVRDVSTSEDAAKKLSVLLTAMTLTPAFAPALGGVVVGLFGWRAIFVALAVLVGILLVLVLLTLPETNRELSSPGGIGAVAGGYARLLRSAKFRNFLLAGSCGGTSLYAFLAVAPFLITDVLRRPPAEVGLYCLLVTLGMAVGTIGARFIAGRLEIRHAARRGNFICLGSAAALLAVDASGHLSVPGLVAPLFAYSVGIGVAGPNVVAGVMNVDPRAAGSASSLYGFAQMAAGAGFTLAVGLWHDGSATPVAIVLLAAALLAALALQRV